MASTPATATTKPARSGPSRRFRLSKATYTYDALDRLAIRALTNQTPSGTTHFIHMLGGGGAFDDLAPGLGDEFGGRNIAVVCTPSWSTPPSSR